MKFTDTNKYSYMLKSSHTGKCLMCNEKTEYVDIFSHGRFCSSECYDLFYKKVDENEKRLRLMEESYEWE